MDVLTGVVIGVVVVLFEKSLDVLLYRYRSREKLPSQKEEKSRN